MTNFMKPQKEPKAPHFTDLVEQAVSRALDDCKVDKHLIEFAAVGNMFGNGYGQRSLYPLGIYDIPIVNCHNACATGSNALYLARQMVSAGIHECALAVGVEKMKPGSLGGGGGKRDPTPTSLDFHYKTLMDAFPLEKTPPMAQFFGNAGRQHMKKYGTTKKQFAMVAEKNHRHSANNPYAQFKTVYTLDEILESPSVHEPLTKLQCSPTSDGAAAAIVCSEEFVRKHGLGGQAIEIVGQSMKTDANTVFSATEGEEVMKVIGYDMAKNCAQDVYTQAGLGPNDVNVVELHDCFSCNELITYEALGLAKEGEGGKLIESGNATYGGKYVINPSGGLISKGHPLGATGVAQCAELCWQLRGECGKRQVSNAQVGLQHNLGLGGCCVITMYKKPTEWSHVPPKREVTGALGFAPDAKL